MAWHALQPHRKSEVNAQSGRLWILCIHAYVPEIQLQTFAVAVHKPLYIYMYASIFTDIYMY